MSIYLESPNVLGHMFNTCTTGQISEFVPQKRGFRIHGHSTTIRLEAAFWHALEDMARDLRMDLPEIVEVIHDHCLVANDKNLASCLRVICLKYAEALLESRAGDRGAAGRPRLTAPRPAPSARAGSSPA